MKKLILILCLSLTACALTGSPSEKWVSAQKYYYQAETKCLDLYNRKKIKTHADVAQCVSDRSADDLKYAANDQKIINTYMGDLKKIGTAVDKKRLSVRDAKIQRSAKWTAVQKSVTARQKQYHGRSSAAQRSAAVQEKVQQQEINQQMLDTLNSPITSPCTGVAPSADCTN